MANHRASIIVSTWNGRHLLETCLPRLLQAVARAGGDHEVIVVDDASTDDTVDFVRRQFPQVRLISLPRNVRFAGANNAAAEQTRGEVLVFLNNDMLVEEDFLSPLLEHFADPDLFAATARIEMTPKRVGGGIVRETGLVRTRYEDGFFVLHHEEPTSDDPVPVLYAGGGSSAVRRDRFLALGGFDRLFRPFYFEDLDISYRAQKAGWRILYEPRSRLTHAHRATNTPENFPGGYVELMFGKNSLLFTWKVLTDPVLIAQHFCSLWRRLMRPLPFPGIRSAFLRAALQLPELLVSRQRARRGLRLSDRQVLQTATPSLHEQIADAGALPYGSAGTGRRLLVLGFAPLPFEKERRLGALTYRTWHVTQALLAAGHDVTLIATRMAGAYEDEANRPSVLRFRGDHFTYYSVQPAEFEDGFVAAIADRVSPEAIVTVHAYPTWVASRLRTEVPLWADLNGYAMTEAQARAAVTGDESCVAEAWKWERAALARADAFSVVSMRQKYALIGELAGVGRLRGANYGKDPVYYLPNAVEPEPYRHTRTVLRGRLVGERDFVVLWAGGYNTWTDVDTLFSGLTAAMREEPRLRFVSLGGAMPGRDEVSYYRFRRLADESEFPDRFIFTDWVPNEEVPNYYFESDVGINIDRFSYEMLIGCRYRILDMLRAGLPVVTTLGTEISEIVEHERLGMTFPPGDAEAMSQCLLTLSRDESRRRRCGERARDYVLKRRSVAEVMKPLQLWARDPQPSPDRLPVRRVELAGASRRQRRGPSWSAAPLPGILSDVLARAFIRRRPVAPWGTAGTPPDRVLIVRGGSVELARRAVERMRERAPWAVLAVAAPQSLADETHYETGVNVTPLPAGEACGYLISRGSIGRLRETWFDLVVVAGEGNRRAELVALLAHSRRRVEIRDDGAAHEFWFAPYKPLLLLARGVLWAAEKLALTALLTIVWGSITAEGWVWAARRRAKGGQEAADLA